MRTYRFTTTASESVRCNAVIQLRRDGFTAWMDDENLHTDASVADIALAAGNALRVIEI